MENHAAGFAAERKRMVDFEKLKKAGTLKCCKVFYEEYGAVLIHRLFPDYENRIAVGLVGEGSECFGFDDSISRDHDFSLGFIMWLSQNDYSRIGSTLENVYRSLMIEKGNWFAHQIWGSGGSEYNPRLEGRRGVQEIGAFYGNILKIRCDIHYIADEKGYLTAEERWLSTAVNGAVFRDDAGIFTSVRNAILSYYPEQMRLYRIARCMHLFSHGGQSNYPRMMARKDYVTARMCLDLAIQNAMQLSYLLGRTYAPYYKWQRRGLDKLGILSPLPALLDELAALDVQKEAWRDTAYSCLKINTKDKAAVLIESIALILLDELRKQGIVSGNETFLESHLDEVRKLAERS